MSLFDDYYLDAYQKAYNFLEAKEWCPKPLLWAARIDSFDGTIISCSIRDYKATHYTIEGAIIRANEWEWRGYDSASKGLTSYWKRVYGTELVSKVEENCNNKEDALRRIQDVIDFIEQLV